MEHDHPAIKNPNRLPVMMLPYGLLVIAHEPELQPTK